MFNLLPFFVFCCGGRCHLVNPVAVLSNLEGPLFARSRLPVLLQQHMHCKCQGATARLKAALLCVSETFFFKGCNQPAHAGARVKEMVLILTLEQSCKTC